MPILWFFLLPPSNCPPLGHVLYHIAQCRGSATDTVNPHNTDPTRYHCYLPRWELGGTRKEFRSLWGGVCASNELCLIYNIACTDASAFQKEPLQLHWRIEQFYPASSLPLYVSISLYWRYNVGKEKILSWPFSSGYRTCYKTKSNTCSEGGR